MPRIAIKFADFKLEINGMTLPMDMAQARTLFLKDEQATTELAIKIATAFNRLFIDKHPSSETFNQSVIVYLLGDLGAGKSFLSRALIQSFLPDQKVKSPTYTLVETYKVGGATSFEIHHFDLYRLCEPEELEYLAIRDLLSHRSLNLVEWPSKGQGVMPEADLVVELEHLEVGRNVQLHAKSDVGKRILGSMS